jgi:hypothetical protein
MARARDWVLVKADAIGDSAYRYVIDGREYVSERVTPLRAGTSDLDNAGHDMLARARSEKKPLTVFVNPANPGESVVDRTIPWMFGRHDAVRVRVGAAWRALVPGAQPVGRRRYRARTRKARRDFNATSGVLGIWCSRSSGISSRS